ncbi:alanyl-tRNA editing protein [Ahrensia sp. R2A130]|uniref:alanyl-tRNA editing protein n=1 Tax=Ahrensia sp. R2A130 TaxID=744979 RepID=UPI0001E08BFD|nr:alanyl-tRNA editing protein [Ahrensia sp. R2A130]EFL89965.1 threonyl/alanyl tRNA synthetase SAD [Ahrensia sp. R2A130]
MTRQVFTEDAYAQTCDAVVVAVSADGIELDQTVFYATSGGQPGDSGFLERADGSQIVITGVRYADGSKITILHEIEDGAALPDVGEKLIAHIDWERRHRLMRMHTACHLLSVALPLPITGAAVSETDSRIDFDMTETADKAELTAKLMELVEGNHSVFTRWITPDELAANPGLVKSKNVRPPTGVDRIRLVCIGDDAVVDSQPCGGTHVSETGEIGEIHIGKIEKKGRENRRMRIRFGPLPQ